MGFKAKNVDRLDILQKYFLGYCGNYMNFWDKVTQKKMPKCVKPGR